MDKRMDRWNETWLRLLGAVIIGSRKAVGWTDEVIIND